MNAPTFSIVHEDEELLVINKMAGLVCHPTKGDALSSLVGRIRLYLGSQFQPHFINRLDRETSGIVVVTKTASAAAILGRLWEQRKVEKEYLAIVKGIIAEKQGAVDAPLGRDSTSAVAIKDCVRSDGAVARTEYRCLATGTCSNGEFSFLKIVPRTGRKHQIRIHLEHVGHPIVGDKLYGGDEQVYLSFVRSQLTAAQIDALILPYQALHAAKVRFFWTGREMEFEADPEPWFLGFVARFAGK